MDNVNRDYYEVIGLPHDANQKEIDEACIRLADKYHLENNSDDPLAAKHFALIEEIYETLGVPEKRAAYDLSLRSPRDEAGSSDFKVAAGTGQPNQHAKMENILIKSLSAAIVLLLIFIGAVFTMSFSPKEVKVIAPVEGQVVQRRPKVIPKEDAADCTNLAIYAEKKGHNFVEQAMIVDSARRAGNCVDHKE